jgi:hypothetical protein
VDHERGEGRQVHRAAGLALPTESAGNAGASIDDIALGQVPSTGNWDTYRRSLGVVTFNRAASSSRFAGRKINGT